MLIEQGKVCEAEISCGAPTWDATIESGINHKFLPIKVVQALAVDLGGVINLFNIKEAKIGNIYYVAY